MTGAEKTSSSLVAKSCPTLATPWTVACQAPLSVGFSRHEYWNELPFPSPGDLPNPGIEPGSPALQADSSPLSYQGSSGEGPRHPLLLRDIRTPLSAPSPRQNYTPVLCAGKD